MRSSSSILKGLGLMRVGFVVLFVFASIFVCIFLVSSMSVFLGENRSSNQGKEFTYRYMKYNEQEKMFKRGFLHLPNGLPSDGFISNVDGNGNHLLISDFGLKEYQCTGVCSCEGDLTRRSVSTPLIRGITYFLAAMTPLAAYQLSKQNIHNHCIKELENECSPNSVISEVVDDEDVCHPSWDEPLPEGWKEDFGEDEQKEDSLGLVPEDKWRWTTGEEYDERFPDYEGDYEADWAKESEQRELNEAETKEYFQSLGDDYKDTPDWYKYYRCTGICMAAKIFDVETEEESKELMKKAEVWGCEKQSLQKDVRVWKESADFGPDMFEGQGITITYKADSFDDVAKMTFMSMDLQNYCENVSMMEYDLYEVDEDSEWGFMCVGHNKNFQNLSVKCVKINADEWESDWE